MNETMRSTLRNHERQTMQQSRSREPLTHTARSAARSSSSFSSQPPHNSRTTATTVHRKPVGSSGNSGSHNTPSSSITFSTTAGPAMQNKPVRGNSSITRQQKEAPAPEKPRRRERKGLVTMYREAPPSDGEILGAVVKEGWKEWQEKRKRDEAEKEATRESLGLKGGEDQKDRRPRLPPAATFASSSSSSSSSRRDHGSRPSSRPTAGRAGTSLHGYTKHTTYEHDNTKPDDLDVLVSKVADKLTQWGKGISERSAGAKEKKMEERQRKEREALKKTISSPRPADSSNGRPSFESSVRSPSFSSEGSSRPLMGAGKTGGSMADRMAKRDSSNFEIPFWPRAKKDKSTAPQHTLPHGNERVTQVGDFMESELASAPWNQHVTKSSPFSSPHSSRSSSPSAKFFGRFVPSPTFLFGAGGQMHTPKTQRRGSDDSFFGCQGISVDEENAAQHLVQQDGHNDGHIESLDFRAPPTPRDGARGLFGRRPPGIGQSGGCGDDDNDDARKPPPLVTNDGAARVSPLLRNAQHRPMVSDQGVDRCSVAAELVGQRQRRNRGHDDAREAGGDDHRVSWWDPPRSSNGQQAGTQKTSEDSWRGEAEAENLKYWKDYRKNLRGTNFSRGSGWEDGKRF